MYGEEWAEPTQQNYSATKAALTVTGDRAEKIQEDRATKTRHPAFITEHSTDSVASEGQKVF